MNSCAGCHAFPAVGGSSPTVNPQVAVATLHGARNTVPSFITINGPVREARFQSNPNGTADGGVHDLFVITGRSDAPSGCNLAQTNFGQQVSAGNVIFRVPTPVFGGGLIEAIDDATILANQSANSGAKSQLGISGRPNFSGNDGTITRFGWKAQNKSLLIFAGEAYNVEQGVSNELFPNERNAVPGCVFNPTPEDSSNILNGNPASPNFGTPVGTVSEMLADFANFAAFMRLSAPALPSPPTPSTQNGSTLFNKVGCALCHSPSLTTAASGFTGMGGVTYQPYSDFALHHMGRGLADGINQGGAGADQFRTAPLWGVGQRLFFLHDGRTSDLLQAIKDHGTSGGDDDCRGQRDSRQEHRSCGSEADAVIRNFKLLNPSQVQDILNFLRSL
jgi:CxxC motif-containing protein (DUF1111 family)